MQVSSTVVRYEGSQAERLALAVRPDNMRNTVIWEEPDGSEYKQLADGSWKRLTTGGAGLVTATPIQTVADSTARDALVTALSLGLGDAGYTVIYPNGTEEMWTGTGWVLTKSGGAGLVSDVANPSGLSRTRFINVTGDTLPVDGVSGTAVFANPVAAVHIDSVRILSGTLTLAQTSNLIMRYSLAATQNQAQIDLPTTFPTSAYATDLGEIGSFNLITSGAGTATNVSLPESYDRLISLTDPISRIALAHNLTGVTLQIGISAVEA
jgi:hypothetical protein